MLSQRFLGLVPFLAILLTLVALALALSRAEAGKKRWTT
jgi:predicted lysophospholipase L1 biosynthesis ABC-type transport system permease subunit